MYKMCCILSIITYTNVFESCFPEKGNKEKIIRYAYTFRYRYTYRYAYAFYFSSTYFLQQNNIGIKKLFF